MQNQIRRITLKWTAISAVLGALVYGSIAIVKLHPLYAANTTSITSPLSAPTSSTNPETEATYNALPVPSPGGAPPLVMFVMSRDEQLSVKAYTDYTDLLTGLSSDTGVIQTTYSNSVTYDGYFDSDDCYVYVSSGTNSPYFKAAALASNNQCSTNGSTAPWSGNFLNWLTMTRLDIVRKTLYGGKRSVDVGSATSQQTVLQRAFVPNDVHSWVKIYPNTNSDINQYTPFTTAGAWSFCNTSSTSSSTAISSGYNPLLLAASGSWPNWASTEASQCEWSGAYNNGSSPNDYPSQTSTGSNTYDVYVDVCDNNGSSVQESFCRPYAYNGVTTFKPAGLLQSYGESGQLRFGLITGSYDKPRSGGILRRNIGLFADNSGTPSNGCNAASTSGTGSSDEVDLRYGTFCSTASKDEGIINTLNRIQITQWSGSPGSGGSYSDCGTYDIVNRDVSGSNGWLNDPGSSVSGGAGSQYNCSDWGNPLAEMYAEALRYIANQTSSTSVATSSYQATSSGEDNTLGMPYGLNWNPPYTTNNFCAGCSIIILSTGQTTFDSDELPSTIASLPSTEPTAATNTVGSNEGYNGNSYLMGYYGTTPLQSTSNTTALDNIYQSLCVSTSIPSATGLAQVRGICPETPALEGSYLVAGLAYDAWTNTGNTTTGLIPSNPVGGSQKVETYAVALAESLPNLSIPLGSNVTSGSCVSGQPCITLAPLCQSNTGGSVTASSTGWRACSFENLQIGQQTGTYTYSTTSSTGLAGFGQKGSTTVFGLPNTNVTYSGVTTSSPIGQNNSSGSISIVWDDSSWGNDHDLDQKSMISWCVGSACSNFLVGGTGSNKNQLLMCQNTDSNSPICSSTSNTPTIGANQMLVRVEDLYCFAGNSMLAGFTVTGSASAAIGSGISGSAAVYSSNSAALNGDGAQRLFVRPGSDGNANLLQTTVPTGWSAPQVVLINAATSGGNPLLNNPLFYAAEYGGFTPTSSSASQLLPTPVSKSSSGGAPDWDNIINATGAPGSDGIPDNYFEVHNPQVLQSQLAKVFNSIIKTTGSGTAAAVVANQREGDGATYQAYYVTSRPDEEGNTANWLGSLVALFLDGHGNLRACIPCQASGFTTATLTNTDYTNYPVVQFVNNASSTTSGSTTTVNEYGCDPTTTSPLCSPTSVTVDQLQPIWNARNTLEQEAQGQTVTTNRAFGTIASKGAGRYIFTYIDKDLDGNVDSGEQVPFLLSSFQTGGNNTYGILNVADSASAQNIINYVRGQDSAGLRNRSVDYLNTNNKQTYPLGDIVNSTPVVVGAPAEAYDLLYNDQSYGAFRAIYQDRRQVVYVGANDGMLHAFNAGFFTASTNTFALTGNNSEVQHPLGAELWAYVPFNLLPHLTWLTEPTYGHVFYFDGTPRPFDAHVFPSGCTALPTTPGATQDCHPYGWGTLMIVGMRFGGGDLSIPACTSTTSGTTTTYSVVSALNGFSNNGTAFSCSATSSPTINTHSAYAILDITNPEEPPTVIAEITGTTPQSAATAFGFTTSGPAPIVFSKDGATTGSPPTGDIWYLIFGNGPDSTPVLGTISALATASSTRDASAYLYQLTAGSSSANVSQVGAYDLNTLGIANTTSSFVGDPTVVDWNLDFVADNIYFGIQNGSAANPGGSLVKVDTQGFLNGPGSGGSVVPSNVSNWTVSTLVTPGTTTAGLPVVAAPSVTFDTNFNHWIYAGTGRLYVAADQASTEQQALFGLIDPTDGVTPAPTAPNYANFVDETNAVVYGPNAVSPAVPGTITGVNGSTTAITEAALETKINSATNGGKGWKITLAAANTSANNTAQRIFNSTAVLGSTLFSSAYTPNTSLCLGEGTSVLFGLNYVTGVANPLNAAFGTNSTGTAYNNYVSLGAGVGAAPGLHLDSTTGSGGQGNVTVVTQTSTGSLITSQASVSSTINNSEIDWRQTHPNSGP
jgi:type IV pilus assembly protein PilY1